GAFSTKAPMPTARSAVGVGVIGTILYVVGGKDSAGTALSTLEAFDPAGPNGTWTTLAPMPTARSGLTVVALFDGVRTLLYAIGGFDPTAGKKGAPVATVEVYDPTTNT